MSSSNTWRTLTKDEWGYLLNSRSASTVNGVDNARFALGTVAGMKGLLIFPDHYVHPHGVAAVTAATINESNLSSATWGDNTYSAVEWVWLEAAGMVFLPAGGFYEVTGATSLSFSTNVVCYWSATGGYALKLPSSDNVISALDRQRHCAVRLVRNGGDMSVSASVTVEFATGNLQYRASDGRWRLAINQYNCIGAGGGNTVTTGRSTQTRWIDLYGFGTSGWDGNDGTAYMPYANNISSGNYSAHNASETSWRRLDWGVYNNENIRIERRPLTGLTQAALEGLTEQKWDCGYGIRRTTGRPKFTDDVFARLTSTSDGDGDSLEEYLSEHKDKVYDGQLFAVTNVGLYNNYSVTYYHAKWDAVNGEWGYEDVTQGVVNSTDNEGKKVFYELYNSVTPVAGTSNNSSIGQIEYDSENNLGIGSGTSASVVVIDIASPVSGKFFYVKHTGHPPNASTTDEKIFIRFAEGIDNTVVNILLDPASTGYTAKLIIHQGTSSSHTAMPIARSTQWYYHNASANSPRDPLVSRGTVRIEVRNGVAFVYNIMAVGNDSMYNYGEMTDAARAANNLIVSL